MFLEKIKLDGILTFKAAALELRPLNVLIGANAAGKSNLIRAIGLLRVLPKELAAEIAAGGGTLGWFNRRTGGPAQIALSGEVSGRHFDYSICLGAAGQGYEIVDEQLRSAFKRSGDRYRLRPLRKSSSWNEISPKQSVLAAVRSP